MKTDVSLATLKLKERIVGYLQHRYHKMGTNDAVSWRGIWIESGATEEEFRAALSAAAEAEIVFSDSDHIRLTSNGRLRNKALPTNVASLNATTSEQLYGRTVTLIRLFLQFRKNNSSTADSPVYR